MLVTLDRFESRRKKNLDLDLENFYGLDSWTAYELSWLGINNLPKNAVCYISYPCSTKNFLESKSLKLYLHTLNDRLFSSEAEVADFLKKDLTDVIEGEVSIEISNLPREFIPVENSIDQIDIKLDPETKQPNSLVLSTSRKIIEEEISCTTFRSLCPLSGQPDWATVRVFYEGKSIDHSSLLIYFSSYRNYGAFHEECVERIFCDLIKRCGPSNLTVQANFLRRGGIEINPLRSTKEDFRKVVLRDRKQ